MKILFVIDGMPPRVLGGAGRIVRETADYLAGQGHDITILTADDSRSEQSKVRILRLPVLNHRWSHWRAVFGVVRTAQIMKIIRSESWDVVHAHTIAWQFGYRFIAACARRGIPVFFTAHDAMTVAYGKVADDARTLDTYHRSAGIAFNPFRNAYIRKTLQRCTRRFSVSHALKTFLENHGIPPLDVLHNGIDVYRWMPMSQEAARTPMHIPAQTPVFLLAGRISAAKGSQIAITSLPPDALLLIAGATGKDTGNIRFLGMLDEQGMRQAYAAADAVLVPSTYLDPFPTVCLEAMAMGRAVIATSLGGAKEAVIDGKTGWVIDPENTKAWKERMEWCTAHRSTLTEMGKVARSHVEQNFPLKQYIKELEHIYKHV